MLCNQCLEPEEKDQRKKPGTTNSVWSEVSDLSQGENGHSCCDAPAVLGGHLRGLAGKPAWQLLPRDGTRAAPCAAAPTQKRRFVPVTSKAFHLNVAPFKSQSKHLASRTFDEKVTEDRSPQPATRGAVSVAAGGTEMPVVAGAASPAAPERVTDRPPRPPAAPPLPAQPGTRRSGARRWQTPQPRHRPRENGESPFAVPGTNKGQRPVPRRGHP